MARAEESPPPAAWVYLLRCADGSLYTGWTSDLTRRLARHEAGVASRYTASRLPVALALALAMPDRGAARREEARIKRLDRPAKLALIARGGPTADSPRPGESPGAVPPLGDDAGRLALMDVAALPARPA